MVIPHNSIIPQFALFKPIREWPTHPLNTLLTINVHTRGPDDDDDDVDNPTALSINQSPFNGGRAAYKNDIDLE